MYINWLTMYVWEMLPRTYSQPCPFLISARGNGNDWLIAHLATSACFCFFLCGVETPIIGKPFGPKTTASFYSQHPLVRGATQVKCKDKIMTDTLLNCYPPYVTFPEVCAWKSVDLYEDALTGICSLFIGSYGSCAVYLWQRFSTTPQD
jgi:hypothetical protein